MYVQSHNLICEAKASLLSRKIELSSYRDHQKDQPFPTQAEMLNDKRNRQSYEDSRPNFLFIHKCINHKFFR